jgi:hypothetical protein
MFYDERPTTTRTDESRKIAPPTIATDGSCEQRAFISADAQAAIPASSIEGISDHDETNPGNGIHAIAAAESSATPAIRISIEIGHAFKGGDRPN